MRFLFPVRSTSQCCITHTHPTPTPCAQWVLSKTVAFYVRCRSLSRKDVFLVAAFHTKVNRVREYVEKLYWNVAPSCKSSAIQASDCACGSCLLPHSSASPPCFAAVFMRPPNAGFFAAGVGMWWVGPVARYTYKFSWKWEWKNHKQSPNCPWIAGFSFECAVFDVLTSMWWDTSANIGLSQI